MLHVNIDNNKNKEVNKWTKKNAKQKLSLYALSHQYIFKISKDNDYNRLQQINY